MSQQDKSRYYKALKAAGASFDMHYREYSTEQLKAAYDQLSAEQRALAEQPAPAPAPIDIPTPPPAEAFEPPPSPVAAPPAAPVEATPLPVDDEPAPAGFFGYPEPEPVPVPPPSTPVAPVRDRDPNEMPGQRQNSREEFEIIRVDDMGRQWLQEEITKPAYPKPRARRVLTYVDTGVKQEKVKAGEFVETFEVAGDEVGRTAEVKITMPSYQVGVYMMPSMPFRIHCYNGVEGFNLFDVHDYYHGADRVPAGCKRIYVENDLCYDIRTVVRAIEDEYRHLQLTGKVE